MLSGRHPPCTCAARRSRLFHTHLHCAGRKRQGIGVREQGPPCTSRHTRCAEKTTSPALPGTPPPPGGDRRTRTTRHGGAFLGGRSHTAAPTRSSPLNAFLSYTCGHRGSPAGRCSAAQGCCSRPLSAMCGSEQGKLTGDLVQRCAPLSEPPASPPAHPGARSAARWDSSQSLRARQGSQPGAEQPRRRTQTGGGAGKRAAAHVCPS